jgi:putative transposase
MESLYQFLGITRQGFHQHLNRRSVAADREQDIVERAKFHRQIHMRMGARPLYVMMGTLESAALLTSIGRDKFEKILMGNGLRVQPIRIFHRTTYSGAWRFPNLVEGLQVNRINQVWISDLTYYRLLDGWAYLTFILDLYSRRCLGYALSENLATEQTTLVALKMALKTRGLQDFEHQLIFHSDGGGQYYDKDFLSLLEHYHIQSSMAEIVYENPHMERFHGTAKNDYLIPWGVNSVSQLRKQLPRFVRLYNQVRPHENLKYKTPVAFEQFVQQIPLCQRPVVLFKKIT